MHYIVNERWWSTAAIVSLVVFDTVSAQGKTVIKNPGDHPETAFELEPHLILAWDDPAWANEGLGLGVRAGIPLMHQGPIKTINNNMAIGFGLDYVNYDCETRWWWRGPRERVWRDGWDHDCSAHALVLPVVLQWNFYITDVITVFGEPGLAIRHAWLSAEWDCNEPALCEFDDRDLDLLPVFEGGAKFMFSERIGFTARIGYPHLTAGVSFMF